MQLTIGIDVDDVLIPLNEKIMEEIFRLNEIERQNEFNNLHWGFSNYEDEVQEDVFKLYDSPKFASGLRFNEGVEELIEELQEAGHKVVLVTSTFINTIPTKSVLLETLCVPIIYTKNKELINLDVLVDDSPKNIIKSRAGLNLLFDQPWNRVANMERSIYRSMAGVPHVAVCNYEDIVSEIRYYNEYLDAQEQQQ